MRRRDLRPHRYTACCCHRKAAFVTSPPTGLRTSPIYAWFVVAVLALANGVSFIDRLVLSLLVGPIKRDLHLSDTQFGLLAGLAFALFYAGIFH